MKIVLEKTKYHRFALYYEYSAEMVKFCRLIKDAFGFREFSFDATYDRKRWVFSSGKIVEAIAGMYPTVDIEPQVKELLHKENIEIVMDNMRMVAKSIVREKKETDFRIDGIKGAPYMYQNVGVEFIENAGGKAIIADEPGCIAGDQIVIYNRGGNAKKIQMRELHRKMTGGVSRGRKWDLSIKTMTRSYGADGLFKLCEIKKTVASGFKKVVKVSARTDEGKGYSITLTPDHKILTPTGWVEAGRLKSGDEIYVNGDNLKYCDLCKKKTPHSRYKYSKFYKTCKNCIYYLHRDNYSKNKKTDLPNGEGLTKDGYIEVSGCRFHPLQHGQVSSRSIPKHILVYEAYLNDMSYDMWLAACRHNALPNNANFVNTSFFAVHHIDGDKTNNNIGNLTCVTHSEHALAHSNENVKKLWNIIPSVAYVTKVVDAGETDTYDIQMKGPDKNFISSGVVVHNCGKTIQALGYAVHKKFNRTLVVCPASVKFAWENEVYKWTDLTSAILDSKTDISKIDPSKNVWIINYDILPKFAQALAEVKFDYIIGDEAHMIKTPSAKRTKAFRFIALNVPNVVLLTGTPLLSRPSELFSLLNIIDPKTWTSYYSYVRRYCDAKQTRFGLDTSGVSNPEELHARINNYFIRRKKEEVLSELPPKSYIRIPILLSDEFSSEYHHAEEDLAEYLWQIGKRDHPEALTNAEAIVKINTLRQICANGKVSAATEMIETIIASGQKVLVFASFVEPLKNLIEKYKDSCVVITGETSIEDRKTAVDSFQNDPNIKIFFGGYKSAGVGITLTAASNVIFLDYAWNPADHRQAEDRAHRPGATAECLNIYQVHAMNTLDEKMANVLKRKQEIFDRVIEGEVVERDEIDMVEELLEDIMARYPKKVN